MFIETFGLPFGMFMSQPVCMKNGEWKPNYKFPAPDEKIIFGIISNVRDLLASYNLGNKFNLSWRKTMAQICGLCEYK